MITQEKWIAKITAFGFCILAGKTFIAVAERYFDRKPTTAELRELHANARLISAAPDLLDACKRARELYDHLALGTLEAACKYGDNYEPPIDEDWLNMRAGLEQAIANATEE